MNDLTVINKNGQLVIDSREVAEMVGKQHSNLMRDVRGYVDILTNSKLNSLDFFIESTYTDSKGEERPCYLLTKKGCDMVANKMTGEKGVLFTAKYVTKFEEMEKQIKNQVITSELSPQLQLLINMELEQKKIKEQLETTNKQLEETKAQSEEIKQEVQAMREIITLSPNAWRTDTTKLINAMATKLGGFEYIKDIREESYKLLNERYGVDVKTRLTNKRRRMADEGVCKSKRDKLTVLDVIADDKKLIEGYLAIVKEMAVKYGVKIDKKAM